MPVPRTALRFFKQYGGWLWLALVLGFAAWFGVKQQGEIREMATALRAIDARWVAVLVALQAVVLGMIALSVRSVLGTLGYRVPLPGMVTLHLQRMVVSAVTPVGSAPSMALFIHRLRERGVPPAASLLTVSLRSVVGNLGFLLLLVPVLALRPPSLVLVANGAALALFVGATVWLLRMALGRCQPPRWVTTRMPRRALRFLAEMRTHDVSTRGLTVPFTALLVTKLCGVATLLVALHALGHPPHLHAALTAWVASMVVVLIVPVFEGIGLVEVTMAVALQQFGVPVPIAVGATLLTRMAELYLPLALGLLVQIADTLARRRAGARPTPQSRFPVGSLGTPLRLAPAPVRSARRR